MLNLILNNILGEDYYPLMLRANTRRVLQTIHMWYSEELPIDDRIHLIDLPLEIKTAIFVDLYMDEITTDLVRGFNFYVLREDEMHAEHLFQACYRVMFIARYGDLNLMFKRWHSEFLSADFMLMNLIVMYDYFMHHKAALSVCARARMNMFLNIAYEFYSTQ